MRECVATTDRECVVTTDHAATRDAVSLLALFLYHEAGGESVRTREAIAATLANRVDRLLSGSEPSRTTRRPARFIECLRALSAKKAALPAADDPLLASCRRIAQRAVSGALQDPTGGCVRFHELSASPSWASGLNPCAWFGSYLFYGEDDGRERSLLVTTSDGRGNASQDMAVA